jgi:short subunit dehydrogenase-like uncharacterized protein
MEKNIDITIYGATGFTGKLIVHYLAKKLYNKPFTLAIAGRNKDLLLDLKREIYQKISSSLKLELIVADSSKEETLLQMARKSKVIISTVGPYLKYGEPLIKACIQEKAHYLDLTGEGKFVEDMIQKYESQALTNQVKLINCCGYDSIPADLGTYFAMKKFSGKEPVEVECFISFSSTHTSPFASLQSFSGGTWHSALGFMNLDEIDRLKKSYENLSLKCKDRNIFPIRTEFRFRENEKVWGAPLPFVDIEVVLRSAIQLPQYGPNFSYGHYAELKNIFLLFGWIAGFGALFTLAQIPFTKEMLLKLRQPKEGPPQDVIETNYFKHSIIAKGNTQTVQVEVTGGDPGYGDTSKMISECALALLEDELPEVFGFLTPAVSMGDALLTRLPQAGIQFQYINP